MLGEVEGVHQQRQPAAHAAAGAHAATPVSSAADGQEENVKPAPKEDAASHSSASIDRLCAALEGFMHSAHRDEAAAAREAAKQGFRSTYTTLTIAAVLIVTITYGGLFSASNGQDTLFGGDYDAARALWWSNSLAFYFAIATLLLCSSEVCGQGPCCIAPTASSACCLDAQTRGASLSMHAPLT